MKIKKDFLKDESGKTSSKRLWMARFSWIFIFMSIFLFTISIFFNVKDEMVALEILKIFAALAGGLGISTVVEKFGRLPHDVDK